VNEDCFGDVSKMSGLREMWGKHKTNQAGLLHLKIQPRYDSHSPTHEPLSRASAKLDHVAKDRRKWPRRCSPTRRATKARGDDIQAGTYGHGMAFCEPTEQ